MNGAARRQAVMHAHGDELARAKPQERRRNLPVDDRRKPWPAGEVDRHAADLKIELRS